MSKAKQIEPMYKTIWHQDRDAVKKAAYDHLVALLHKVSMRTASDELMLLPPTLYRCLDEKIPVESINFITASHVVFMCVATDRLVRILDDNPRVTAYYKHERINRLAARNAATGATK
jgi:hypothetical protein